jgi:signal transduction histidine kinase
MNLDIYTLDRFPFLNKVILQSRISWSIRLRWLAVIGYFSASLILKFIFHLEIPYQLIWTALTALALINFIYLIILKSLKDISFFTELVILHVHIIIDLFFLTVLIHFSGGLENPVYLFYIFHVVISSIIFPLYSPLIIATLVIVLFTIMVILEYQGMIPHYTLFDMDLHQNDIAIILILTIFTITIYFTEYICTTFMRIYRDSKRIIDRQNQQLIDANEQRTRFFMFASHELKAPVIAIKSSLDGILKTFSGSLDQKALNLLRRASLRSDQMLDMIREMLDISKIKTSIIESGNAKVAVHNVLKNIIQHEKPLFSQKKIKFEVHLADPRLMIPGRQEDFERVFLNLINNAIRYTAENGRIQVNTTVDKDWFVLQVTDSGVGIPEEDLDRIFDEFYRSENARKMVNFGTGLGLSLVKQIVQHYHGSISVSSKIGQGSTFTVKFPLKELQGQ